MWGMLAGYVTVDWLFNKSTQLTIQFDIRAKSVPDSGCLGTLVLVLLHVEDGP